MAARWSGTGRRGKLEPGGAPCYDRGARRPRYSATGFSRGRTRFLEKKNPMSLTGRFFPPWIFNKLASLLLLILLLQSSLAWNRIERSFGLLINISIMTKLVAYKNFPLNYKKWRKFSVEFFKYRHISFNTVLLLHEFLSTTFFHHKRGVFC